MTSLKQQAIIDEMNSLWAEEANKRKQEIKTKKVKLVDGEEVFRKIAQKYSKQ